ILFPLVKFCLIAIAICAVMGSSIAKADMPGSWSGSICLQMQGHLCLPSNGLGANRILISNPDDVISRFLVVSEIGKFAEWHFAELKGKCLTGAEYAGIDCVFVPL